MTITAALSVVKLLLWFAAYFAKRAERQDIEAAILSQLEIAHGKRVDAAVKSRDDVMSGQLPADPKDPYRRD